MFKTKLDLQYPRQDAPTQLALDYSPVAGATLRQRGHQKVSIQWSRSFIIEI